MPTTLSRESAIALSNMSCWLAENDSEKRRRLLALLPRAFFRAARRSSTGAWRRSTPLRNGASNRKYTMSTVRPMSKAWRRAAKSEWPVSSSRTSSPSSQLSPRFNPARASACSFNRSVQSW
ncbi:hypothetical protein D3C71_1724830 [compost metagenome]